MKQFSQNELRKLFLDFFASKDHYIGQSASLIPEDDPSVLLIGAGMAPLKKYFTGVATPPKPRMATCQKCIRIGDLDNVGRTARHLTFFEMLGNFSFGDYFKSQSLAWGMEFITKWLEMDPEKLWATIYEDDDEAYKIWTEELQMPTERVVRLGKDDNFWEIGQGPCGPCSEIYIDRGPAYGCGKDDCKPGCDCDRFLEFWNHVFTQFNKNEDGSYTPLKNKNIDTGMGLERLAVIVQGVDNVFETDVMVNILRAIEKLTGKTYGQDAETNRLFRIIADHIRSVTFLIGDGVIPSNEGRGYILRKLLRRASLQLRKLGLEEPVLSKLSETVIEIYSEGYPLLSERRETILQMIRFEEDKFHLTLRKGLSYIDQLLQELPEGAVLEGQKAFRLYDTFGFPLELTEEILADSGHTVDKLGFETSMEEQRMAARNATDHDAESWQSDTQKALSVHDRTVFTGYELLSMESKIVDLLKDGSIVQTLVKGDEGVLITEETPFYATSGGQIGDKGIISHAQGSFLVRMTEKKQDLFFHTGEVLDGTFSDGQTVLLEVDAINRNSTAKNHSATHLLHKALGMVVGDKAQQAGSLVDSERLRFDFTYFQPLTAEELKRVEDIVNDAINRALPVSTRVLPVEQAKQEGAKMLFTEKYGDTVRVVSMGDFSKEFCGGTHITNTATIGLFKILSERGIASGVRRIEALTGKAAFEYLNESNEMVKQASQILKTEPTNLIAKIEELQKESLFQRKELQKLKDRANQDKLQSLDNQMITLEGANLYALYLKELSTEELKQVSDNILSKDPQAFTLLFSSPDGKISIVSASSEKAQANGYKAGEIIKAVASRLGGGGGGRPNFASAGAKDVSGIEPLLNQIQELVTSLRK